MNVFSKSFVFIILAVAVSLCATYFFSPAKNEISKISFSASQIFTISGADKSNADITSRIGEELSELTP